MSGKTVSATSAGYALRYDFVNTCAIIVASFGSTPSATGRMKKRKTT